MTYADIREIVDEVTGAQTAITDATMLAWANEAVKSLVDDSNCLEARTTVMCQAETRAYDLPDDCDRVRVVAYDGSCIDPVCQWELQRDALNWDTDAGTPRQWYVSGMNEQIGLWPIPTADTFGIGGTPEYGVFVDPAGVWVDTADASLLPEYGAIVQIISGLDLDVQYWARPGEMTLGTSVPDLPAWAHPLIAYYMLRAFFTAHTAHKDYEKAGYWARLFARGRWRLRCRTNGRLPREWVVRSEPIVGHRGTKGRLPDVVDVTRS